MHIIKFNNIIYLNKKHYLLHQGDFYNTLRNLKTFLQSIEFSLILYNFISFIYLYSFNLKFI